MSVRFTRSSSAMRRASSLLVPGRWPRSTSAWWTHVRSDSGPAPSCLAMRVTAPKRWSPRSKHSSALRLADLAGGHAGRTFERRLRAWARPALLILDDFAMREFSAGQADDLYELVTERAGRSLVITANRAAADWYPLFPNPVVAESILDRVVNSAHHVLMEGRSHRPMGRPGRRPAEAGA